MNGGAPSGHDTGMKSGVPDGWFGEFKPAPDSLAGLGCVQLLTRVQGDEDRALR